MIVACVFASDPAKLARATAPGRQRWAAGQALAPGPRQPQRRPCAAVKPGTLTATSSLRCCQDNHCGTTLSLKPGFGSSSGTTWSLGCARVLPVRAARALEAAGLPAGGD